MGIRKLFASTWVEICQGAQTQDDACILPEQMTVIFTRNVGKYVLGQLIVMCDETGRVSLISARFCQPWLALSAYLHCKEQSKRLASEGIEWHLNQTKGVVTCTYSRIGFLDRFSSDSP